MKEKYYYYNYNMGSLLPPQWAYKWHRGTLLPFAGTIFYHLLEVAEHEMDGRSLRILYSWDLWRVMLWYGLVFVTALQSAWLYALKNCTSELISTISSSLFVHNIIFSVIILNHPPTTPQYVGGAIIVVSIISSGLESHYLRKEAAPPSQRVRVDSVEEDLVVVNEIEMDTVVIGQPPSSGSDDSGGGDKRLALEEENGHTEEEEGEEEEPTMAPLTMDRADSTLWNVVLNYGYI